MSLALIVDAVVALLLIATIAYAAVLNRRLTALRNARAEMETLVDRFAGAAEQGQSGLEALKRAADESGQALQKDLEAARSLADDLAFLVDKGNGVADRLEQQVSAARTRSARAPAAAGEQAAAGGAPGSAKGNDRSEASRAGSTTRRPSAEERPEAVAGPAVRGARRATTAARSAGSAQPASEAETFDTAPLMRILRSVR